MSHAVRLVAAIAPSASSGLRGRIDRDALWLFSGYALTAGCGFVFWILAALWIPQAQLGIDASILSIVAAAAALASIGPGSALVVMLPLGGAVAKAVLLRANVTAVVLGAVLGVGAGMLVAFLLPRTFPAALVVGAVSIFTVISALLNAQTQALVGAGDARGTLVVNGSASLAKLALLIVFVVPVIWMPHALVAATALPAAAAVTSCAFVLVPLALRRQPPALADTGTWSPTLARTFRVFTAQNAVAVGLVLCAGLSLSFIVTVLASPAQGAVFAIAFQFSVALDLVGVGVATALARNAVREFDRSARLARGYALKVALIVVALGAVVVLITPLMFLLLGTGYEPLYGMAVVGVLAVASAIRPGYDVWSALMRSRHRVLPVLGSNAGYVALLYGLAFLLVPRWGALGAALAVVGGAAALAVVGAGGLRNVDRGTAKVAPSEGIPT